MLPPAISIEMTGVTVPTYGLLVTLAWILGLGYTALRARAHGIDPWHVPRGAVFVLAAAWVGARIPEVILHADRLALQYRLTAAAGGGEIGRSLAPLLGWVGESVGAAATVVGRLLTAGSWFQFAVAAALVALVAYVRRHRIDPWLAVDVVALYLPFGQALGRLGCLAAGCCYGRPADLPWSVVYSAVDGARVGTAPLGVPLHPVQLYSTGANLLLLVALVAVERRQPTRGLVAAGYLVGASLARIGLETFRDDPRGTVLDGYLSLPQGVALATLTAGLLLIAFRARALVRSRAAA